jgi:hypothetical protein
LLSLCFVAKSLEDRNDITGLERPQRYSRRVALAVAPVVEQQARDGMLVEESGLGKEGALVVRVSVQNDDGRPCKLRAHEPSGKPSPVMGLEGDRLIGKLYVGWDGSGWFDARPRQELAHEKGQPDCSEGRHDENPS